MASVLSIFRRGLEKTATSVGRSLQSVFSGVEHWDKASYERLEEVLLQADFGVPFTMRLVDDLRDRYERGKIKTSEDILALAGEEVKELVSRHYRPINFASSEPTVILLVGVNGSGKTTTAGKLAWRWGEDGKKVMLAACDTFRAAAVDQLKLWGERCSCPVISARHGADPSAVAYDAVSSAQARGIDVLLLDTAGRQHTKKGLMEELSKMRRVVQKVAPGAPHEVWLTVDASIGSNALVQAREFSRSAGLTGLVLTKLDGTGRGGMVVAIQEDSPLPVFFIGLGERPEDLQPFAADMFVEAVFQSQKGV